MIIDEKLCTGCKICSHRCPLNAIEIINLPEALNQAPIHRYGENMFELFSLPSPLFGQVTGILGKNGIGKSTALKVLAKQIQPNLGDWKTPSDFKEIINHFKGTEMQGFLEKLHKDEITLSYKPQQVDLIPKQFSGTVKELLQKVAQENRLLEIVQQLGLTNFMDTPVANVSGGELQRVAIAATVLKKANLFLFDEPTSYLDIKQRIKISQFIRSLADKHTAVMAIEHDLIILDYMTDLVNIMYGQEGAYGVVSGLKSTREGINSFLEGYLREENTRFRGHPIKFDKSAKSAGGVSRPLISWTALKKKLGQFKFEVAESSLNRGEIVGILGENGIGKTSFVKMLAGVLEPDSGGIEPKVKVSYKPQYLETSSELMVMVFLQDAINKFSIPLIRPLEVEKLFTKKLCELSGGELQRVSIVKCLSQDAELFLLDEPSAYLDVEQRLLISKVISALAEERGITILVVDHDLMFLDYLSDRLMVFSGTPAREGKLKGPFAMETGMNLFLQEVGITLRRDLNSKRPRINKLGSVKDREQRQENKWYYG
ncbi:ribosome biogenesis/translation initiation ATPase RLI [Candidatus Woesearchaeota archaeon]|nr:ribosome biogenesis/translation initiation ATPase RLI [Candidatus Woesearchaeota archaeon]